MSIEPEIASATSITRAALLAVLMGQETKNRPQMVFDWVEAAKRIVASAAQYAVAGLDGDWGSTHGPILNNGSPVPAELTYTYLSSSWAIPSLVLDDGPRKPCYVLQHEQPAWDAETYWPEEALVILRSHQAGDDLRA